MNFFKKAVCIISTFFMFFGFLTLNVLKGNEIVKASEEYYLQIEDQYYSLPLYLYSCDYDAQQDKAFLTPTTDQHPINTYYISSNEYVLSSIDSYPSGYIEEEAYQLYGDDALPTDFWLVTSDPITSLIDTADMPSTISGIKEALGEVFKGIPLPEVFNDCYDTMQFVQYSDQDSPVINGYEGVITSNVDSPITLSYIKSLIRAEDEVDGDLTDKIIVEQDNFTGNERILGEHLIVFSVSDNSGNKATLNIYVDVVDLTVPEINGPSEITTYISSPISTDGIKAKFTSQDNYDGNITSSLEIAKNTYEGADLTRPGTYEIVLKATDTSGNFTTHAVTIKLLDDVKPLISGDQSYVKNYDTQLTLAQIKENLTASDNVDGNITANITVIQDLYTGNESKVGKYNISFEVTDTAGNISNTFIVQVTVVDETDPVFYIDKTVISAHTFDTLSLEEIESYLIQRHRINTNLDYEIEVVTNEYEENKDKPGMYDYMLRLKYENNTTDTISLQIFVNDNEHDFQSSISNDAGISFWAKIWEFLTVCWNAICSFFVNAWNTILAFFA